jgi:hypothetical protein
MNSVKFQFRLLLGRALQSLLVATTRPHSQRKELSSVGVAINVQSQAPRKSLNFYATFKMALTAWTSSSAAIAILVFEIRKTSAVGQMDSPTLFALVDSRSTQHRFFQLNHQAEALA